MSEPTGIIFMTTVGRLKLSILFGPTFEFDLVIRIGVGIFIEPSWAWSDAVSTDQAVSYRFVSIFYD